MAGPDHQIPVAGASRPSAIDAIAAALDPGMLDIGQLSSPDGAMTLLLADIEEADTAEQQLGQERWAALLRDHEVLVRQLVSRHTGQVVKAEGDGFLASFASAHAGLHCAVALQRTLAGGPGRPAGPTAGRLRAGLHSGFVIAANPDQLMGRNVVLAARIAAQARGGEILVSSALKQYTEQDPSFQFQERGEFHFKGLHGEHSLFAVVWDAA
jgi:adenylate cyclase